MFGLLLFNARAGVAYSHFVPPPPKAVAVHPEPESVWVCGEQEWPAEPNPMRESRTPVGFETHSVVQSLACLSLSRLEYCGLS